MHCHDLQVRSRKEEDQVSFQPFYALIVENIAEF